MTQVDRLRIYFVLPADDSTQGECSSDMKLGFQIVSKYGGYVEWMKPSDCIDHVPQDKDVFVFEKFEGNAFEELRRDSSKYVILGARCLITCITNGRSIPPNPHPVFTEGMRDLWVTSSGFDQATKKQIQEKVQFMSGYYDNSLRSIVTHLVAHNNISSKALHAYKSNIKIMKLSWVEDVWQQSLVKNVNGKDEVFDVHVSPLFHNLNITTSGIPKRQKDALKELIEGQGGNFMGTLEANVTNVVVLTKPEGEKYKFAKAWNIACVSPLWVQDCIEAKAVLSFKSYLVDSDKPKSSTPNKEGTQINFSANFTANLSVINNLDSNKLVAQVDETANTARSCTQTPVVNADFTMAQKQSHLNVINSVLKSSKDAGLFLDGLNIFLHGFHPEEMEQLKKVLNRGGATRFNELSEAVTHVIAARRRNDGEIKALAKSGAYVVSIDWLVESSKLRCKASEGKFLLVNASNPSEPPSPMSKQGAQLLSQTEGRIPHFSMDDKNENEKISQIEELLCRYNASQPGEPLNQPEANLNPFATNRTDASVSKTPNLSSEDFFVDLTFFLSHDLSEEETKYLEDLITERKGQIVGARYLGVPDFAVVPVIGASLAEITAKEVVNVYFVKDCCMENCLLSPRYYHQPVAFVKNSAPLKGCVISVSNYVQGEREFMEMMIEALGGVAQSLLARKPKQGALKSTHLVCAEAQGQKYEGAVRWGLPVVHHDWLLKCASLGVRVSEKPYLIGESKLPEKAPSEVTMPSTSRANVTECDRAPQPPEQRLPDPCPPPKNTPVHSALARVKAMETPKSGSPDMNRTVTPTSPYGAFYGKGSPSPETRKRIWKWMNQGAEFPLDPPANPLQSEGESTPVSQLISRHLDSLKRKPEDLPPDSPTDLPLKRLNIDGEKENKDENVASGLQNLRKIEENLVKNGLKSPPMKKSGDTPEGRQMVVVTESQPHTEVGWEDPAEKEAALKNLEKAASNQPKVFMLSCMSDQLKEVKPLLERRGGSVSPLPYFDRTATHLIAASITRAEKLMGSMAAGLWVLHPSYLVALKTAKSVNELSEEDYEWGSPRNRFRLSSVPENFQEFAVCSYQWRLSISKGGPRPFKDMKILLHLSKPKYDSFERLIEAGGGKVVKGKPPNYPQSDATVCVYEASNSTPINFASLTKQNIQCVSLMYISDILLRKKDALLRNLVPESIKQCSD